MKKDFIITFITEFVVLISGVLVYKLAANMFRKDGFSEYALSKRIISFIQPALLLGLGVGIPRYIAYISVGSHPKKADAYFVSGFSILVFVTLSFMFTLYILKKQFAFLMFGDTSFDFLLFPISLMLAGLVLHATCYAYFRGKLLMVKANFLQVVNMGIVPIIVFFISKSIEQVFLFNGLLLIGVSTIFLLSIIKKLKLEKINIIPYAKELLFYGIQRIPADFGMAALIALPPIFVAHISGVKEAGYIAFGISLVNMAGAAFAPIGLILLPKVSQMIGKKDFSMLKYYIMKILKLTVFLTLSGVLFFEIFAEKIIGLYLGKSFLDLVFIVRLIMIGAIGYTIYVSLRSIIDAYYVRAMNTINIIIALISFIVLIGVGFLAGENYIYVAVSFVISLFILGILTLNEVRKVLKKVG